MTYKEDMPSDLIRDYRTSNEEWIISVGMISEGTNIPRLQVCCHLTNIKTEMHYRQILGRTLRVTSSPDQSAILYMLAEPKLVEYAYRVNQDIPDGVDIVQFETFDMDFKSDSNSRSNSNITLNKSDTISSEAKSVKNDKVYINLTALDKITAKTSSIRLAIGDKKFFGSLEIKAFKCQLSEGSGTSDTAAYIQVKDLSAKDNNQVFLFNGWTFVSSPTLQSIDHPVYDLWITSCENI